VRSTGTLLGLTEIPTDFGEVEVTLGPGDKLLFYTDGAEGALVIPPTSPGGAISFTEQLQAWAQLPAAEFVRRVRDHLDSREGSLHAADDATLLLLEIDGSAGQGKPGARRPRPGTSA
jgi:serine phosphatase RsbU (regulator of sigma subunit)